MLVTISVMSSKICKIMLKSKLQRLRTTEDLVLESLPQTHNYLHKYWKNYASQDKAVTTSKTLT